MEITKELLNSLFEYKEGQLYWKIRKGNSKPGKKAGSAQPRGYVNIAIDKKLYYAHRLIFTMHYGIVPEYIDHIDGDVTNNKIENLRNASPSQNCFNRKLRKGASGTVKGVFKNPYSKGWRVSLNVNGIRTYFGSYDDLELAELVANEARDKYHKQFARDF